MKKSLSIILLFIICFTSILYAGKTINITYKGSAKEIISLIAAEYKINVIFDYSAYLDSNDEVILNLNNVEPVKIIKIAAENAGFELIEKEDVIKIFSLKRGTGLDDNNKSFKDKIKVYRLNYIDANSIKKIFSSLFSTENLKIEIVHYDQDKIEAAGASNSNNYRNNNSTSGSSSNGIEQTLGTISKSEKTSNMVLIRAPENMFPQIDKIIEDVDKKPRQVLLKAIIAEISDDLSKNLGIKWELSGEAKLYNQHAAGQEELTNIPGYTWGRLGQYNMRGLLNAIVNDKKSNILSKPWVLALNHELAQIKVTDKLPYVESYTQTGTGEDLVLKPEVKIEEFGIQLAVLPRISDENNIILEIYPSVTDFIRFETFGSGNTQTKVPFVSVRESYTKLLVNNDELVVLGGLVTNKDVKNKEGIPILSKLPLLGKLFRNDGNSREKTELVMFITSHILQDQDDEVMEKYKSKYKVNK